MSETRAFMSGRVAGTLVALAAAATVILMLLYSFGPDLAAEGDESSGTDATSVSAVGFAGLHKLLDGAGIATRIDRVAVGAPASLTILTPSLGTSAEALRAYRMRGPVLVILPKWISSPMPEKPQWVTKFGIADFRALERMIQPLAPGVSIGRSPGHARRVRLVKDAGTALGLAPVSVLDDIELMQVAEGATPLLVAPGKGVLLVRLPGKANPVYLLSEPDLMNNQGLSDNAAARAALGTVRALRQGEGPVAFDVTLNGLGRAPSLWRSLLVPPFLGASLAAFLAALLIGLHAVSRFGAPEQASRVFAYGKKALADNSASLLRMMGRERGMAQRYVAAMRELAVTRLDMKRAGAEEQDRLFAALERRAKLGMSYGEIAREAQDTRSGGDLLRVARKAYAWKQGVVRGN